MPKLHIVWHTSKIVNVWLVWVYGIGGQWWKYAKASHRLTYFHKCECLSLLYRRTMVEVCRNFTSVDILPQFWMSEFIVLVDNGGSMSKRHIVWHTSTSVNVWVYCVGGQYRKYVETSHCMTYFHKCECLSLYIVSEDNSGIEVSHRIVMWMQGSRIWLFSIAQEKPYSLFCFCLCFFVFVFVFLDRISVRL